MIKLEEMENLVNFTKANIQCKTPTLLFFLLKESIFVKRHHICADGVMKLYNVSVHHVRETER